MGIALLLSVLFALLSSHDEGMKYFLIEFIDTSFIEIIALLYCCLDFIIEMNKIMN